MSACEVGLKWDPRSATGRNAPRTRLPPVLPACFASGDGSRTTVDREVAAMTTPSVTAERGDEVTACAAQYERWGWTVVRAGDRLLLAPNDRISAVELLAA